MIKVGDFLSISKEAFEYLEITATGRDREILNLRGKIIQVEMVREVDYIDGEPILVIYFSSPLCPSFIGIRMRASGGLVKNSKIPLFKLMNDYVCPNCGQLDKCLEWHVFVKIKNV